MAAQLERSFLAGRDAGAAVTLERLETRALLVQHQRWTAAEAILDKTNSAFWDYMKIRGALLAGGPRRIRLNGGRNLDG